MSCKAERTPIFRKLPNLLYVACCSLFVAGLASPVNAQGAGGGGSGAQQAIPAFNEPKFKDRLYEMGGPKLIDPENGRLITEVIIEGNESISEHNILSYMLSREDRQFDKDIFSRDVGELHRTGYFQRIEPYFTETSEGIQIRLKLTEKPTIQSVSFHGATVFGYKKLLKYCGFAVGDPISPHVVLAARNRLEDYYRSEGFNQVNVQVFKGDKPGDRDIIYRISEGELERIWEVKFVGSKDFSPEILMTKIKSRDAHRFVPNLTTYIGNKAIVDTIEADKNRLVNFYRSLGYFDARIDNQISYGPSGKWVTLTFVIAEGQRYSVRNVTIEGNQYYPTEKIQPFLELRANDPFRQVKKDRDEKFLRDSYGAAGFIFANVVAQVTYLPNNQIDINYSIEEGDIYRASEVNVHIDGDSRTKERVVLVNLGNLRPGELINSVEVENAERRLQYSTIFETNPSQGAPPHIEIKQFFDAPEERY